MSAAEPPAAMAIPEAEHSLADLLALAAVVALRAENVCDQLELGHPERIGRLTEGWGTT